MAERARFISRYGNFSVGVQSLVKEHFGTGESKTLKRRIDAQFQRNLVTDEDLAFAVQSLHFPGLPFDNERNHDVSPRFRIAVWDSAWAQENEGFSDDEIALIVKALRTDSGNGTDFVETVAHRAAEPFPNYNSLSVDAILNILEIANIDPKSVVEYEAENQNRQDLIEILVGVQAGGDTVVVEA